LIASGQRLSVKEETHMGSGIFEKIVVVDFGWILAAPMTSKYLADLGATVIRVESSHKPDGLRTSMPYKDNKPGINRSAYFALYNPNKYSMALNLKHPKGVEIAKRLIARSDIVVENFIPGAMKRLGLTYEDLVRIKADIIMIGLSMQGQTGPYANHLGFGNQLTGLTGFTQLTGWPDRGPVQPYAGVTDACVPSLGAATVIAALIHRRRTGKGQYIDLSQNEASIHYLSPLMLDYFSSGKVAGRSGNECSYASPHGSFPCQGDDRWCAIAVFTDQEWEAFCRVLGNPAWAKRPEFSTLIGRKNQEKELNELISEWTQQRTAEDVMQLMQAAGVAAGILRAPDDLLDDPQLKHREHFWQIEHSELGNYPHIGESFQLSDTPVKPRLPAPSLGEHTEYVCREIMKMTDDEFMALLGDGVFE
jgi:benzylsuccinate CoA-transferase BbsF subunit